MLYFLLFLFVDKIESAWQLNNTYDPVANKDAIVLTTEARFTVLTPNLIRYLCIY